MVLGGVKMHIIAKDVIGSNIAVSAVKGEVLFNDLSAALNSNDTVELDFMGITDLTTAFLNVAIGHLYKEFSSEELNVKLKISNLDDLDKYLLMQVVERVKMNQQEEEDFRKLINEVLDDGDNS